MNLWANKAELISGAIEPLVSGMSNSVLCEFSFSDEWEGLTKTAVFTNGKVTRDVILYDDTCYIPNEVLDDAEWNVSVGVYGTDGANVILPTIWASLGIVQPGADPSGDPSIDPTPSLFDQMVAGEADRIAAEEDRADAEELRATAETARASAEGLRATAETARAGAETARANAESSRASAESARGTAESGRVSAESARASAESSRSTLMAARMVIGAYSSITAYNPGNEATYDGSTYRNTVACTGVLPTVADNWILIAKRGTDGVGAGAMLVETYDADADGKVNSADDADTVNGHTVETDVPSGALFTDTVYTHPANHSPSIITQDADNRFVSDTEKTTWNDKQAAITASGILKGSGSAVSAATAGTDYQAPMTITTNANASPALGTLANNTEYRCTNTSLSAAPTITIAAIASTATEFSAAVIFKAPNTTAPVVTNNSGYTLKYSGTDVSSGTFTPVAGKVYRISFLFDGIYLNAYVMGVEA